MTRPCVRSLRPSRRLVRDSSDAAREALLEAPLRRGGHLGPLHRMCRLRDRLPARRAVVQGHRGRLQAVPDRGLRRPRRLLARRQGLHLLHPRLPPVPGLGARRGRVPFGRTRQADEVSGIYKDIVLAKASDPVLHEVGQDGALVSAILLYCLEKDIIDAELVSYLEGDGSTWKAVPGVAKTREEI